VAAGEFDSHHGLDVIVTTAGGALIFDRDGVEHGRTIFQLPKLKEKVGPVSVEKEQRMLGDVRVVDLENDGISEYVTRGGLDGAAVFDHGGRLLWTYGKYTGEKLSIRDLTVGDLDGDGIAEFIVSWDGIEVFDKSGKRRSKAAEEFSPNQIEIVDTDGDDKKEIVSLGGEMKIRDASGQVIKEVQIPTYVGTFSLCNLPGTNSPAFLTSEDSSLKFIDFNGTVISQFHSPLSEFPETVHRLPNGEQYRGTDVYKATGVWVTFAIDRQYLAVIKEFAAIDRAVLDVFTSSGELVYQEVMPESCESIAVLPSAGSGASEFLVSGAKTVWRYRLNAS
jgi:hypothetical protein